MPLLILYLNIIHFVCICIRFYYIPFWCILFQLDALLINMAWNLGVFSSTVLNICEGHEQVMMDVQLDPFGHNIGLGHLQVMIDAHLDPVCSQYRSTSSTGQDGCTPGSCFSLYKSTQLADNMFIHNSSSMFMTLHTRTKFSWLEKQLYLHIVHSNLRNKVHHFVIHKFCNKNV